MHEEWDDVLVQRFIAGREVNVGIVGGQVLPIAEIDFSAMPDQYWRIVSYRSKWETGSDEDVGSVPACPADLPERSSPSSDASRSPRGAPSAAPGTAAWTCASMTRCGRGFSR
jgi:D-alanine-D-alanine ligase-like ATP-grasp enzyme